MIANFIASIFLLAVIQVLAIILFAVILYILITLDRPKEEKDDE